MELSFLAKLAGATVLGGVITLGVMTTWTGKDTVDHSIEKIQEMAGNLDQYEANENQLVQKIEDLKTLRANLQSQVESLTAQGLLDGEQITTLQGQIATATDEIEDLENQLATVNGQLADKTSQLETANSDLANANTNGETMAQRIADLEAELQEANSDIARLQAELNSLDTSGNVPLTDEEIATILETEQAE